jgi:hypothetical protein
MPMKYGVSLPQGWVMDLVHIKDPVGGADSFSTFLMPPPGYHARVAAFRRSSPASR